MPAGAGGKRKRGDRSWSGDSGHDGQRPSPHRPGNLNLAQHNQPQSPSSRQGSGDHTGRRRRPSRGGRTPSGRVQTVTQDRTKPATDSSMAAPSNAAPETRQVNGAGPRETPSSEVQTSAYPFEYVTQVILDRWLDDGKRKIVSQCVNARNTKDLITLGCIFQELIRAVLARKLEPSEAGETVKQILADNNDRKSEARHSDDTSTSSFFLNTLSILAEETNVSTEALKSFILATGISPALLRLELDTNLVQGLGLVRETFTRIGIRKQTNVLYRQSNYNLLREESEGYSKLVTELFTTSNTESPSSEIVEETFERVKAMIGAFDLDVGRVLDVTLDVFAAVLVKKYHFFVRFLRASSWWPKGDRLRREEEADFISGLPRWAIPGWTGYDDDKKEDLARARDERDRLFWDRVREIGIRAFFEIGRRPLSDEDKEAAIAEASNQPGLEAETRRWIEETGTLPPKGNRVAAQLLGFKLRFYSTAAREAGYLPENLIWVAALLIKIGFISLRDLYPHLWRDDDLMPELEEKVKKEKLEREMKAKPGGGINALMLAGALPDDTVPAPVSRPRDADARSGTPANDSEAATIKDDEEKEPSPEIREQKVDLLKSLLTIGAVPEALYMLSRFPWLMDIPELPDYIHRIVHHCLSKLYTPLRPMQGTDHIRAVKPIPSLDQSGVPKGQVRLIEAPPRKLLRWAHPDKEDREDGINYRFYWDHWADTIPVCQSVDDFFGLASSLLNVSGFRIGQDPLLMSKIARIAQNSLSQDDSETNKNRWRDFCKRLFLPALSLSKKNPGVANEVFAVIRHFPRAVRYNMYAEWHFGQTSRQPEIKSAFDLATAQTRDTLKRLSKTNIKAMARALAEIAYANPGIVINVEITQIESYDNLIDVVVECARYFTDLGYDILAWALINSLGQKGRSRVQQGGMLTSRWLNALSTFTGKAFKRYSVLNPMPILQYVLEQLRHQNSTDLIVLERIVSSMAGIVTDTNFNDAQIQGMAGGSLLQAQTMLQLLDKRHESRTTSKRLMKALTDSKLAGQLLIAIAQERLLCVYRESEMVPELKLLGNIFDEIHRILTQYLDLLRSNLTIAEFDAFVPGLPKLIGEFGLQPDIAFWITRPSLSKQIADADRNSRDSTSAQTLEAGVPASETVDGDVEMTEGEIAEKKEDKPADGEMDVDNPSSSADSAGMTDVQPNGTTPSPQPSPWHPVLRGLMDELEPVLSPDVWLTVGLPFYVTFWQLSLYDVHIPGKAYEDEIERQKRRAFVVSNDRSDLSIAGTQKKEREKKQIQELQERLLEENKQHLISYEHIRNRLQREKDHWFPSMRGKYEALNLALLEQCFLPRLLLSPIDSFYSFKMMKFLHVSGTPNFRTVGLLDQLFREHRLTAIIFQCTSKEADNFGKFLNEVLRDLTRWHSDRALYEKEAWGTNKTLPGFAMNVDAEGKPTSFVDYEMFRRLLYKWHRLLAGALKTCFNGGEYMHIRNAISVLKAVSQHFPAVNWMGRDMLQCVNSLSNDEREDVKIPAASLKGDFSRREKEWLLPQAFMINENLAGDKGKARPSRTDTAIPKQLNAQAAEFKPPGANGTLNDKMEVEDGEIEDAKMADAAKVTRLPANEEAIVERAKLQKGAAETLSSVDKVERTTLAQEEKRLLPEAEQQLTSTPMKESDNARARTASPAQSRHTSRPPDLNNAASIPKRPDLDRVASQPARLPPPPNLPNKPEPPRGYRHDSRSVRQSDLKDDRRDSRHMDSSRSSRHPDSDRDRLHDRDSRAPSRVDRDRAGAGPPSDDQFRPPRDARGLHREPEAERPGPSRSSDSFSRDGPPGSRPAALPHPDRADRIALIESDNQHRDPARPDRDDRRNRLQSPPRTEARRGPRHDDYPTAPRSDRAGRTDVLEGRDTRPMRQIEPPSDIPSGPRSRAGPSRGRNASMSQPSVPPGTPSGPSDRQPPTGPSGRSSGRGLDSAAPSPAGDKGDTIGVHPDRLKNLQVTSEASPASSRSQAPLAPPSGPRSSQGHISGSPVTRGPPPGPGNDRNRGDKRFAGINNMLQQSGGSQDRSGQGTMIRGRGRQASSTNVPSLHEGGPVSPQVGGPEEIAAQEKTELFPSTRDEDNRSAGRSRRSDATTQEANRESKRSGRHAGPPDTPDRDRRDEEENTRAGRRDERRDRGRDRDRDRDRDRNRRNDNVEDELHQTGRDSGGRRTTGGRDDHRKRDRRDREDEPSGEIAGPGNGDHHGRTRPSSSHNNNNNPPPPLPPPPAPSGPANEERRWGSGRGENRERDRNRDRGGGGRDRERDYNRDGGPVSGSNTLPRKRGRPGDDLHGHGDGGNRGMRAGSESKRARRGT